MSRSVLIGEFVDLHPLTPDDAAITFNWRQSRRAVNLNRGANSVAEQANWISSRPDSEHNFVIRLKNGTPVGMISLTGIDHHHGHAEPGRFLIGDENSVRGLPVAVEAMKLIYELAFDTLKLIRVHGSIASANKLMIKWQLFLGMKEEGRLRQHYFIDGRHQDAVLFGMLENEYRTVALPRMNALIASGRSAQDSQKGKEDHESQ